MFSSTGTKLVCEKLTLWQSFLGNSWGATAVFARPRRADLLFIGCQRLCLFDSKLFRVLIYFYLKPHIYDGHQNRPGIWQAAVSAHEVKRLKPNVCDQTESSVPADLKRNIFTARAQQSQPVNKRTTLCRDASINHLSVYDNVFAFCVFCFFVCQQVLRRRQVFPKKQHDFVSNGLWGRSAEWKLWDTGPIVGTRRQRQPAPHVTHNMDVQLHLEKKKKDKRLSACLQYFLKNPFISP